MDATWIEHRRGTDRELLGWIQPAGEHFVAVDLLGHARTGAVDWIGAEEALDALGIGYLAEPYELKVESGAWLRVRITEVSTEHIRVAKDDWSANDVPQLAFTVPFPVGGELRTVAR
jgi:hypothetical protein